MTRLASTVLVLVGLLYPFAVYFGLEHVSPRWFALLLAALWLMRALTAARQPGAWQLPALALVFCGVLALSADDQLLRLYPVLINAGLAALFAHSLYHGMPVIERLARLQEPDLPPSGVRYTRQVTKVWLAFFLANGSVALLLSLWAPLSWWTLYNGLIAYLLMGCLFIVEWLVRQRVKAQA